MSAYALYYYDQCPFCQMVLREIPKLKVELTLCNTLTDASNRQALMQGGGRTTVPCLKITSDDGEAHWMYESRDIMTFLKSL